MPIEVRVNGKPLGYCAGAFYAVRIGSAKDNEIIIAETEVQPHHCTLVHTGSTYRLEAPPSFVVYLDGEQVKGGHQFLLDKDGDPEATLTLGMAPDPDRLDSPRSITLRHVDKPEGMLDLLQRKRLNREAWRVPFSWLGVAVLALAIAGGVGWWKYRSDEAAQDARINSARQLFNSGEPDRARLQDVLQHAMVRVGIEKDGGFLPVGTGWLWNDDGQVRLVTNRHVRDQINNCVLGSAADSRECRGKEGGCPAADHFDAATSSSQVIPLADCATAPTPLAGYDHPDYDAFEKLFPRNSRNDGEIPNIFDIAVLPWPAAQAPWGAGLTIASEDGAAIARGVATVGFPLEGEGAGGVLARTFTFRPAAIGRLSDPFGMPGGEQHFLVLTGSEVQGGESGGPVINQAGQVIGMLFGGYFTRSPGDDNTSRLSIGNKVRALDARLIIEAAGGGAAEPVGVARRERWQAGMGLLGQNFQDRLIRAQVADSCADERVEPVRLVSTKIEASRDVTGVNPSAGFEPRFAHSETLEFPRDPAFGRDVFQTFVVLVSSAGERESPVFMQIKRVASQGVWPERNSNSALTSLASVKDDVQFQAGDSVQYEYVVYSQLKASYTLQVYRIACQRKSP